ncbi:hypothetical protein AMTR_s00024p00239470, partial [Amborella trichopoda]
VFNIPLHICNLESFKLIGNTIHDFIRVHWQSSEFLPLGSIQVLIESISPELIPDAIWISLNSLFYRVHLAWIPASPPSSRHFPATPTPPSNKKDGRASLPPAVRRRNNRQNYLPIDVDTTSLQKFRVTWWMRLSLHPILALSPPPQHSNKKYSRRRLRTLHPSHWSREFPHLAQALPCFRLLVLFRAWQKIYLPPCHRHRGQPFLSHTLYRRHPRPRVSTFLHFSSSFLPFPFSCIPVLLPSSC